MEYKPTKEVVNAVSDALIAILDCIIEVLPCVKESIKNGNYDELIVSKIIDCFTKENENA